MTRMMAIDYETADRITLCCLKDQLEYCLKEQEWFEADEEGRKNLEEKWGHTMWVHKDDYADTMRKYIPSLKTLIAYFGGTDD